MAKQSKGGIEDVDATMEEEEQSPIEQVALTVSTTDDPSMPVYTFRMWTLGLLSCVLLSFVNQFFSYRTEPLTVSTISAQIVALPLGQFMASVLPKRQFRFPFTSCKFSLNPGPFNTKEHVLITIFASTGASGAYAISIVNIIKAFYQKNISVLSCLLITLTTQIIGYGWAGIFRSYLVDPAEMWWPNNLVQVSIFRTLHEKEVCVKGQLTRMHFFLIALTCSFCYYVLPGYLFTLLSCVSWVCWAWPNSVTAHQIGSGLHGLGIGAFGLDWATVSSYFGSPLSTPWFAIANVAAGYLIVMYVITPLTYWNNIYDAKKFPIFSNKLFAANGERYNLKKVLRPDLTLNLNAYENYGRLHISTFFAFTYGVGFAALAATVTHVALFHGKQLWRMSRSAVHSKRDVHTRLMQKYSPVPQWWFYALLLGSMALAILVCLVYKELQLPWWGLLLACAIALSFTLPIGVITATTNQTPGLNVITELIIGYLYPGRPLANVCFKTYGYISMVQAVTFLQDLKLGHYMKIPPRSMFFAQVIATVVAAVVNLATAWWLLESVTNICNTDLLPETSMWTCPGDTVFFDASVIWGLIGPKRIFGSLGLYKQINWFFAFGALAPVGVWLLSKAFPRQGWIRLINMPILIGATGAMPPATSVNYINWCVVGFIFSFVIFRRHKAWWTKYNYVLSAALDAGVAFTGVLLYAALSNSSLNWWGNLGSDNCPLASCPTAPNISVPGCPVYK